MSVRMMLSSFILFAFFSSKAATITSINSGNWSNNNTWDCSCVPGPTDNVVIGTHIITMNQDATITDLNVTNGGIVTSNGKTLTITGNITNNGSISGSIKFTFSGTNNIGGDGVISTSGRIFLTGGIKTILAGSLQDGSQATLGVIDLDAGVTVINYGSFIAGSSITGTDATSVWIQAQNGTLKIGNVLLANGTLYADSAGNTIEYYRDANNQAVKAATNGYYNLTLSGSGNKNLDAALDINGNLDIQNCTLDPNDFNINIAGNWTNNSGIFTEGLGEVIFDGTGGQTITAAGGETYYDLRINKASGSVIFAENVNVLNTVYFDNGNINAGGNRLTVGSSTASAGTITITSGYLYNGEFKKWVNTTGVFYDIPVGTSTKYARFRILFTNLVNGAIIIEFIDAAPGNNGMPVVDAGPTTVYNTFSEGYWKVAASDGMSTTQYGMRLQCDEFTSFTLVGSTRIVGRVNPASNWILNGNHIAGGGGLAKRNVLTTLYGNYAVADITNCTAPSVPVIAGNNTVCTNDMAEGYSVTDNGDTYTWTVTGGTITGGQSTSSITVDWGATGMEGNVEVIASNACTSTFPVTYMVDIGPLPTSAITGKTAVAEMTLGEPYSVVNEAGYTYTWTITGGTLAGGQGTNSITVDWGVEGTGNVSVVGSNVCDSAPAVDMDINIYHAIESVQSGNFGNNNTWICNCTPAPNDAIRIMPTHSVRLTGDESIAILLIQPAGILNLNNHNITVREDIVMNGFVIGSGDVILQGISKFVDGIGLYQNTGDISITGGGKTILSSAAFSKVNGNFTIANDITVTSNGVFTLEGSLTGGNSNSRFINGANSTLSVSGVLFSIGTLISTANANTVNYTGLLGQTIFPTTYHHLGASGDGIKSLSTNLTINGSLQISGDASLDVTASNYTITLGGNWTNTSTDADPFVERTSSVTFDGSTLQTLIATSGETYNNFIINNSAGATLNDPLTISGNLTFSNGIINTSTGNELIIADNATTTVATNFSHVDGPMDKIGNDAFVFPVGDAGNYQAIEISAPGTTSDRFRAQYFQTGHADQINMDPTLDHVSAVEYWDLSLEAGAPTIDITLHWDSYSQVSSDAGERNNLAAAHYLSSNWTDEGNDGITGDETAGTIVVNGISTFSPWTLGSTSYNNPLPVKLVDFNAVQKGPYIEISWTTTMEKDNELFVVERLSFLSLDNMSFEIIEQLDGAGDSHIRRDYKTMDYSPHDGFNYYRLKQVDYDGRYEYSKIISVQMNGSALAEEMVIYPNPNNGNFRVIIPDLEEGMEIIIRDISGKNVYQKKVEFEEEIKSFIDFDLENDLNPGIYMFFLHKGNLSKRSKIVVK